MWTKPIAAPGGVGVLEAIAATSDTALATADGSTEPGWPRLMARGQLAGLLHRATTGRPTDEFDEDGNPVYVAPHHPAQPRRTRPGRFAEHPPYRAVESRPWNTGRACCDLARSTRYLRPRERWAQPTRHSARASREPRGVADAPIP